MPPSGPMLPSDSAVHSATQRGRGEDTTSTVDSAAGTSRHLWLLVGWRFAHHNLTAARDSCRAKDRRPLGAARCHHLASAAAEMTCAQAGRHLIFDCAHYHSSTVAVTGARCGVLEAAQHAGIVQAYYFALRRNPGRQCSPADLFCAAPHQEECIPAVTDSPARIAVQQP